MRVNVNKNNDKKMQNIEKCRFLHIFHFVVFRSTPSVFLPSRDLRTFDANCAYQNLPCTAGGASGFVICFRGMRSKSWNVLFRVVLKIRTSESCVVAQSRVAHTTIFGVYQRIHPVNLFFQEGYIMYFEAQILSRRAFFLPCRQRCSEKSREREREQDPDRTKLYYGNATTGTGRKCAFGATNRIYTIMGGNCQCSSKQNEFQSSNNINQSRNASVRATNLNCLSFITLYIL